MLTTKIYLKVSWSGVRSGRWVRAGGGPTLGDPSAVLLALAALQLDAPLPLDGRRPLAPLSATTAPVEEGDKL